MRRQSITKPSSQEDQSDSPPKEENATEDPFDKAIRKFGFDLLPVQRQRCLRVLTDPRTANEDRIWIQGVMQERMTLMSSTKGIVDTLQLTAGIQLRHSSRDGWPIFTRKMKICPGTNRQITLFSISTN